MKVMKTANEQVHSEQFLKKRRFMTVLPVLIFPFITMIFWILGGGTGKAGEDTGKLQGINTNIPGAENAAEANLDKMAFYDRAQRDSIDRINTNEKDPYHLQDSAKFTTGPGTYDMQTGGSPTGLNTGYPANADEERIRQKLAALNQTLNNPSSLQSPAPDESYKQNRTPAVNSADIDRLEALMGTVVQSGGNGDPEMQQISGMLGQILDIQHPERVQERLRENSAKNMGKVYAVTSIPPDKVITTLDEQGKGKMLPKAQSGFYALNETQKEESQNTIAAVMHETQTLMTGSIVKLRLINDIYINGKLIPRNTFIFGLATVSGERLGIDISSIRYKNSIYPVELSVFDLDGLDGIHIPDAMSRNVAKQSGENAIQNLNIPVLDPTLSTQAMGAGLEAAKSLFSQKVRLVKVTVKTGYQILLKDSKQKDEK